MKTSKTYFTVVKLKFQGLKKNFMAYLCIYAYKRSQYSKLNLTQIFNQFFSTLGQLFGVTTEKAVIRFVMICSLFVFYINKSDKNNFYYLS